MKKFIAVLTAVMMIMALIATPVFADGTELGSITINNTSEGNTYAIYQLLDLESYNPTTGAYSYKVNAAWVEFFKAGTGALDYMAINDAGYVTWTKDNNDSTVAAFAKIALDFAKNNSISALSSKAPAAGEDTIKFENLNLGYYLVDSTMGALCGLTTTNPDASINAKNGAPTISKQVKEDLTSQWDNENTADIGQTVEYRVTINVHKGAENYVLHDVMPAGVTFGEVTGVEHILSSGTTETADTSMYTVTTSTTDDCTFEVSFSKEFCDHLATNDRVIVYYTGTLNETAVINGSGNVNTAWLSFGEGHKTAESTATTYTFEADIVKTDSQNTLIDGAIFRIYDSATNGNEIKMVKINDTTFRRAMEGEDGTTILVKDGLVTIQGFDNGDYWLEEISAPEGYNQLTSRVKFTISDGNLKAVFNGSTYSTGSGVHVVNKTGSMLPETGGLGTTIFVTLGGAMVLAAGVVLFAKKRMSQIAE